MSIPLPSSAFEALRPYCSTHRQSEVLEALIANGGSQAGTAKALGVARTSVTDVIATLRKRSEQANPFAGSPDLPADHRLKGVSVLTDADGNLDSRWDKTERATTAAAVVPLPPTFSLKKVARYTDSQGAVRGTWASFSQAEVDKFEALKKACGEHAEMYAGRAKPLASPRLAKSGADYLNLFPLGDPHIGMLAWAPESGENFDLKIAASTLRSVVDRLVASAPPAAEAMLVNVGDYFHIDNDSQLTPGHGNKLDAEGRIAKVFALGCDLMVWMIGRLLETHEKVGVWNLRGNHDPMTSLFLSMWLSAWFRDEPRVTIHSNLNPFSYYKWHQCLFGLTHGDGCKPSDLPEIMAADEGPAWGQTLHHEWITGHVHHDQVKDFRDCVVETYRTLAAKDAWHNMRGYRSKRTLQRKTYHKSGRLIGRGVEHLEGLP